jgi:hypothetical protein
LGVLEHMFERLKQLLYLFRDLLLSIT